MPKVTTGTAKDGTARILAQKAYDQVQKHQDDCAEAYRRVDDSLGQVKATVASFGITLQNAANELKELKQAIIGDEYGDHPGLVKRVSALESAIHGRDGEPGMFIKRETVMRYAAIFVITSALAGGGLGATGVALIKTLLGAG